MTSMVSVIAIISVFANLWATESFAQGRRGKFSTELSSVKELHLETGPLSEQAQRCGLAVTDLEAPAQAALDA